ncbi:MAG: MBL fold metallo-hydrolase [Flavipsychrobacter sp.]
MLSLQSFTFNPFQENTYIIHNEEKHCWIVDPGMYNAAECAILSKYINDTDLIPQAIINTHAHIDHIFGVDYVKETYNIPFGIHKLEQPVLDSAAGSAAVFGLDFKTAPKPDFYISDIPNYQLDNESIEIRLAPGHSPGSIIFYSAADNWLIGGDVLFAGSIGRTDLPGGSYDTLINSIKNQLYTLPDDVIVHSGHGPATQIGIEKRTNPFVQG